ncbi:hypothetical protein K8Q93_02600 [Candidatus Parcubacteria bacterium]|nr:hypothetical protein [Candidatus Parcubacteria bacterium]
MRGYSRGFAAPGAVIFLAVIGIVVWYRNHNDPQATSSATTTVSVRAEAKLSGEGKTSSIR